MDQIQTNNIETITAEILILKQQTAQNIVEIGKRLIAVKESLPHGEWGKWLKEKVDFTDRTAQRFMKAANEFSNPTTLSDLPKSKVFALLDLPAEEREEFIKNNPVDEMTARQLQQAIKEKKELEETLKATEKKAEAEHQAWATISNSYKKLEETNVKHCKHSEKLKKELDSIKQKSKEDIVNKEVEIKNLKLHIESIKSKLDAVSSLGNDGEIENLQKVLQETENKLHDSTTKIEQLEQQLKDKPIDVITAEPVVIEKVPDEVQKELQELREKANTPSKSNEPVVKFSIYFDELIKTFKELLGALSLIEDEQLVGKYKSAVRGLINKMVERV